LENHDSDDCQRLRGKAHSPFNSGRKAIGVKRLQIVLAEDSEVIRDVLKRMLKAVEGFSVVGIAVNGYEAIRLFNDLSPDVLILDINMPQKDGLEVLKEIRSYDSSTVIIMFTADSSPYSRTFCIENGADYFLDKLQTKELIGICKSILLVD
jgi:DNA-binding response OmpR family regulator